MAKLPAQVPLERGPSNQEAAERSGDFDITAGDTGDLAGQHGRQTWLRPGRVQCKAAARRGCRDCREAEQNEPKT